MLHTRLLTVLGAGIGILFFAAAATAQPAAEEENTPPQSAASQVQIPAGQDLGAALDAYIRQTGVELIYRDEEVIGLQTQGTDGAATHEAALTELLEGTGLTVTRDPSGAMAIADPSRLPASSVAGQNQIGQRQSGIEEIIVTGQKREERIQDVPIAISAFSQEDLTTSQIAGGPDLHLQVPNMTFTKTNFTGYSIQIRGIGTQAISATTDPAVAVALNQTPFIRNRFFEQEFYDMERVEVLRGPQGTLFGRNATAGVVNLVTTKPQFQSESMASLDMGNYNSRRWEVMLNEPLVEDTVALRVAAAGTKRDGYAINEITGSPIDGRDLWSSRVSLRIAPNDTPLDINLIWEHFEEDDDRLRSGKQLCHKDIVEEVGDVPVGYFDTLPKNGQSILFAGVQALFSQGCERGSLYSRDAFQTPNGLMLPYYLPLSAIGLPAAGGLAGDDKWGDPYASSVQSRDLRAIESRVDPEYRAKSDIGQLQIGYELTDGLLLESETAYMTDRIFSLQDFNRFNTRPGAWEQPESNNREGLLQEGPEGGIFCDPQLGCSDRLVVVDVSSAESTQFSQELRLSSQFGGPFNFSLGANYLRYDTEEKFYVFSNSFTMGALEQRGSNRIPWVPGETDNLGCMADGRLPGDPNEVYPVTGCQAVDPNPIGSLNDQGHNYFLSKNPYDLTSYALFGEGYYNLTDSLKLTAGLRWSVDRKEAPIHPSQLLVGGYAGHPRSETIELTWREPTGRLVLDWQPTFGFTDETLIYGSYSRGYKAGGANPPTLTRTRYSAEEVGNILNQQSATKPKTFDAEFVDAFEIGTKNTLADGAVTLNATAFYYDYQGYQISEIVDRSAFNRNFDLEVWGAEIETDWWLTEGLRLGFKGGYQKTRLDDGERAVDLMDRTAGGRHFFITDAENPDFDPAQEIPRSEYVAGYNMSDIPDGQKYFAFDEWMVLRPFPTQPSSCVLPTYLFLDSTTSEGLRGLGNPGGGGAGGCEHAYALGEDPQTELPYVPNPTMVDPDGAVYPMSPDYPGFNPEWAPNNGEGFFKDLSGNELPNAPRYTATLTADYVVPLAGDWLATLHTDIYWQSKSWWRVFNDHEYGRLEPYFTMNLAAIFANERTGWDIMAYVKNVTDETAITGAFLFSDDTGLTTNTFLTEPRLYGVRVTKRWGGGEGPSRWLRGAPALLGKEPGEPMPFELTVGGSMLRPKESANQVFAPAFISSFDPDIDPTGEQAGDLDWGDGREIVLTYAPESGWRFSLGARYGESDRDDRTLLEGETFQSCGKYAPCDPDPDFARTNYGLTELSESEEHLLVDFTVGRDIGLGRSLQGTLSAGLRYARLESSANIALYGTPDWVLPEENFNSEEEAQHTEYAAFMDADRQFEGLGPVVAWEASSPLFGGGDANRIDLDWSVSGGVLFGKQETSLEGTEESAYFSLTNNAQRNGFGPESESATSFGERRSRSATVPTLGGELGLTWRLGSASIGAGYRWERYFDAIDGGVEEHKEYDRTIDGPYLNVTFGR